jgi:hypothetical protein
MFVLEKIATVEWPVKVDVPADGGRTVTQAFSAVFAVLDDDEMAALTKECGGDDRKMLMQVVKGWSGVGDEAKHAIPFSVEALGRMTAIPYVRTAFVRAFNKAIYGIAEKN